MTKRVLMVATVPSMIGQFNLENIHILQEMGYEVDAGCNYKDTSVWSKERVDKFRSDMSNIGVKCIQIDFSRSFLKINRHIESYKQTVRLIKKRNYTFIHTHTPIASAIVRMAAHKTNTKVIYTAHGFHFFDGAPLKNWIMFYPIEKFFSKWTNVLITINKEDYKRAQKKFKAKKTIYIPGVGVNTENFAVCKVDRKKKRRELGVKDTDFLLLSVGERSEWKNQKVVIEALHEMREAGSIGNIVYLVVGKGEMENEFKRIIAQYGMEGHVKLLGLRTDIDELCETVDCFVHVPMKEGHSIASQEAMAAGLPLILTAEDGIKDYAGDAGSGCCVDPVSVNQMVKAINRMHNNEEFRNQCGSNNWKAAKTFDIRNNDKIMLEVDQGGYRHLRSIVIRQQKREEMGLGLKDFVMISVGELNDNKNHQVIIRAMSQIPDVKYVIVGRGNLAEQLRGLSEKLGVADRVLIMGYRTDIRELLWMSDCFVFPSKREGLGLAGIEGMSAGLPIISSNIHGIKDYSLNENTGYTCNPRDVDGFRYSIRKLCNLPPQRQYKFSKQAKVRSQHFEKRSSNKCMKIIYQEMKS